MYSKLEDITNKYKLYKADVFKSWGVNFEDINTLRTPTKNVSFIDEEGNIGSHHGSKPGSWAHREMDRMMKHLRIT